MSQVKKNSPKAKKTSPVLRKSPLKVASKSKAKKATPKKVNRQTKPKATKKGTPKKRVPKAKSNAPKRPMSAFFFYMKDNRAAIIRDNNNPPFLEVSKIGGTQWKALKPAQKAKYQTMAEKEKQRYATEMLTYVPSPEDKKKKRKKKDPNAPKRPTSAYIFYVNSRSERFRKEHPELKMTEVMKSFGAEWRALDDRSKKPFQDLAVKDKARYVAEKAKYEASK
jgi:hypothetical protein